MADPEVTKNAKRFREGLATQLAANISTHKSTEVKKIDNGYARLTVLQAFRSHLFEEMTDGAMGFYTEAQSDGLTSQILIAAGMGRSALKSLRSMIENIVRSIYYNDHPIEYRLWENQNHQPTFASLFEYISQHPDIKDQRLSKEAGLKLYRYWKSLSNAVHASISSLRTSTDIEEVNLWKTDQATIGQWQKHQEDLLRAITVLYISLYRTRLTGAQFTPVRRAIHLSLPASYDARVRTQFGVNILR